MFNVGGGEILLICVLALVVVGPEQLPSLLRKLGQYAGQAKQMSDSLRSEFMAGTEPFQESIKEFQKGMNDFSSTVTENADVRTWGTGSAGDPIVPRGFADQEAGVRNDAESGETSVTDPIDDASKGSDATGDVAVAAGAAVVAEPITSPSRTKKLEITPPVNPWAPLPGSGADTKRGESSGTDSKGTESSGADSNGTASPQTAPPEPAAPPTANESDIAGATAEEQSRIAEQNEMAAQQLANRGRERTVIPPIPPFSSFPPRDPEPPSAVPVDDEVAGENA